MLYFEALELYIAPHYDNILAHRDFSKAHLGRDFVTEWHSHLLHQIEGLIATHDKVAVEGYLLRDSKDKLEALLGNSVKLFQIEVKDKCYYVDGQSLTAQQIAALGIDSQQAIVYGAG